MNKTQTITRKLTLVFLGILVALFSFAYAHKASAVLLKDHTVINGATITVGDIFEGVPSGAERVLGPAPQPGQDMVLNARTLLRIAMALDLDWKPQSSAEYIVISSAATIISPNIVESAIHAALEKEGLTGNYELSIPTDKIKMVLPAEHAATAEVSGIRVIHDQNRFEATIVAPSANKPIKKIHVNGTINHLIKVPTVTQTIRKGDIIAKNDIRMIDVPQRNLNQDVILDAKDLIGTTPRHLINAGAFIKANDIEEPKIVSRGDYITLLFRQGPLQLSTRGKALQNGALGDYVRVVNTESNKTIEGLVTASKEVTVKTY